MTKAGYPKGAASSESRLARPLKVQRCRYTATFDLLWPTGPQGTVSIRRHKVAQHMQIHHWWLSSLSSRNRCSPNRNAANGPRRVVGVARCKETRWDKMRQNETKWDKMRQNETKWNKDSLWKSFSWCNSLTSHDQSLARISQIVKELEGLPDQRLHSRLGMDVYCIVSYLIFYDVAICIYIYTGICICICICMCVYIYIRLYHGFDPFGSFMTLAPPWGPSAGFHQGWWETQVSQGDGDNRHQPTSTDINGPAILTLLDWCSDPLKDTCWSQSQHNEYCNSL